ncbi:MAG: biotin/lipoyl-binding protein [Pseudomonadota bacterium]|nr:biotin/lipoyl-binding protein [Pseudomonadota bacterium]
MKEGTIVAAHGVQGEEAKPKKRLKRILLMLSLPLLLGLVGGYFWLTSSRYVSTDNAYVQQSKVTVSAEVSGPIVEVAVTENRRVARGDLLFPDRPAAVSDCTGASRGASQSGAGAGGEAGDRGGGYLRQYRRRPREPWLHSTGARSAVRASGPRLHDPCPPR